MSEFSTSSILPDKVLPVGDVVVSIGNNGQVYVSWHNIPDPVDVINLLARGVVCMASHIKEAPKKEEPRVMVPYLRLVPESKMDS